MGGGCKKNSSSESSITTLSWISILSISMSSSSGMESVCSSIGCSTIGVLFTLWYGEFMNGFVVDCFVNGDARKSSSGGNMSSVGICC